VRQCRPPFNFITFRPKKSFMRLEPRLEESQETQERLESAGLDVMDYDTRWGRYRIRLQPVDIATHRGILSELVAEANSASTGE
jgi:hypothetical protein